MHATKITRRRVLSTAGAVVIASQIPDAYARPPFARGGKGGGGAPPVDLMSITYVNNAGSTSPSDIPLQVPAWFVRGDVPTGSIAVPQISGADQVYQADNRVYWDDGSLRGAVFRIAKASSMAAGATAQINFNVRTGTYSNTSSVTTATITGETDYTFSAANCHTAWGRYAASGDLYGDVYAVTVGGGQITGVKLWHSHFSQSLVKNVAQLNGGSGGQVTFTNGVPAVTAAGSGYTLIGGTGTFSVSLNTIIAAINANGNRTGGRRLEWYAKGLVCDGIRVLISGNGLPPHYHVTFYIERWKKADGTFLAYKRYVVAGIGLVSLGVDVTNYTGDFDFKDGATVICGASGGDTRYQTLQNYAAGSFMTLDTLAQPYWSANGAAFNAIAQQRTPTECLYLRKTGMMLPWSKTIVPTSTPPTTTAVFEMQPGGGRLNLNTYQPMANGGVRSPIGSGGGGNQINPMPELEGLWIMSLYQGLTANSHVWRRNSRVAAAHGIGAGQLGSGIYEPTTMFVPNCVPATVQAFPGMTPTRELISCHPYWIPWDNLYYDCIPLIAPGTFQTGWSDQYHSICLTYGVYLVEGEQWQLDAQLNSYTGAIFAMGPGVKIAKLGSNVYYGIRGLNGTNSRMLAWFLRQGVYAAAIDPGTWSDGTANPEAAYIKYTVQRQFDYLKDLIPFTGTIYFGDPTAPESSYTKSYSYADTGVWPEAGQPTEPETSVPYMESYCFEVACIAAFLHQGTATATSAAYVRDQHALYRLGLYANSTSCFQGLTPTGFRISHLKTSPPGAEPIDLTVGFNATTPGCGSVPFSSLPEDASIDVTSGSTQVTIMNAVSRTTGNVLMRGSTYMPNGSRIKFTTSRPNNVTRDNCTIPSGFSATTWYYWLQGANPSIGQLCTGVDGNGDPDPATAVTAGATSTQHFFWVVFKGGPADNESNWATPWDAAGSRLQQYSSDALLFKALGGPSLNGIRDTAISRFNTIKAGTSTYAATLAADPMYAYDDNLL